MALGPGAAVALPARPSSTRARPLFARARTILPGARVVVAVVVAVFRGVPTLLPSSDAGCATLEIHPLLARGERRFARRLWVMVEVERRGEDLPHLRGKRWRRGGPGALSLKPLLHPRLCVVTNRLRVSDGGGGDELHSCSGREASQRGGACPSTTANPPPWLGVQRKGTTAPRAELAPREHPRRIRAETGSSRAHRHPPCGCARC